MGYKHDPSYLQSNGRRNTTYSRRVRSFLKKSMDLHSTTGAEVLVVTMYEGRSVVEYCSSNAMALWNKYIAHVQAGHPVERFTQEHYNLVQNPSEGFEKESSCAKRKREDTSSASPRPAPSATPQAQAQAQARPQPHIPALEFLPICTDLPVQTSGMITSPEHSRIADQWVLPREITSRVAGRRGITMAPPEMLAGDHDMREQVREQMASFVRTMAMAQAQQRAGLPSVPQMPVVVPPPVFVSSCPFELDASRNQNILYGYPTAAPVYGEFGAFVTQQVMPQQPQPQPQPQPQAVYFNQAVPSYPQYDQQQHQQATVLVPPTQQESAGPPATPQMFPQAPEVYGERTTFVDLDGPPTTPMETFGSWGDIDLESLPGEFLDHEDELL